jgi:hypothetical protein
MASIANSAESVYGAAVAPVELVPASRAEDAELAATFTIVANPIQSLLVDARFPADDIDRLEWRMPQPV